jgi:hypothetical protein
MGIAKDGFNPRLGCGFLPCDWPFIDGDLCDDIEDTPKESASHCI